MATMQAVTFRTGGTEELRLETVERPAPAPTEVLVRVSAAGINPVDWKTRQGSGVAPFFSPSEPKVLGWDVAGTVEALGAGVTRFALGDRVFGMPGFPRPAGAYAQYVVARSRELARIPETTTDVEAGALPLAGLTAWQAVVDTLEVQAGTRILIHAAAGGVGHLAVQIAKARGAEVWGTASAAKHEFLRSVGVDHPIDYRNEDFTRMATGMDAVLDLVGGPGHALRSLASLRRGGQLLMIPSPNDLPTPQQLDEAGVSAQWMLVEPDYTALESLAAMLEAGTLKVVVAEARPLDEMATLHRLGESGGSTGKLVATLNHLQP